MPKLKYEAALSYWKAAATAHIGGMGATGGTRVVYGGGGAAVGGLFNPANETKLLPWRIDGSKKLTLLKNTEND